MDKDLKIKRFYQEYLPDAVIDGEMLRVECPFCVETGSIEPGVLFVILNKWFFCGYFHCSKRCTPGGFPHHFAKIRYIDPVNVPSNNPDQEPYVNKVKHPEVNFGNDIRRFMSLLGEGEYQFFKEIGVSREVLKELKIGTNGQYITIPYYQSDGQCYSYRCISSFNKNDTFWGGNKDFFAKKFSLFNLIDLERCHGGALFLAEEEISLMILKELGYPGVAVSDSSDLEILDTGLFDSIDHLFIVVKNTPESQLAAKNFATRLGYKARIMTMPFPCIKGDGLSDLLKKKGPEFKDCISEMVKASQPFSPFTDPSRECRVFYSNLEDEIEQKKSGLRGFATGFMKLDKALNGVRGINIVGGQPKAGKSCFFVQIATEMALNGTPVIYYDFENGRQQIYQRTLSRFCRLSEKELLIKNKGTKIKDDFHKGEARLNRIFNNFRVVTHRQLTPDLMRRHIEFLKLETSKETALVVIDSLHKLPFKDFTERRTGIDSWLRQIEAIRDEQKVAFLIVSELSRDLSGKYDDKPDMGAFKGSGDIEYCADNAMVFVPNHGPLAKVEMRDRKSALWVVASRDRKPGKIGNYCLDYPYWGFVEEK